MVGLFDAADDSGESWPVWAESVPASAGENEKIRAAGDVARWLASRLPPHLLVELPLALAEAQSPGQAVPRLSDLLQVVEWWNGLAREKIVPHSVRAEPVSAEILRAWRKWCKTPELQALWRDLTAIEQEIRVSVMCRDGWFRLEKLIGGANNKDGLLILKKLLDGGYRDAGDVLDSESGWNAVANFASDYAARKRSN